MDWESLSEDQIDRLIVDGEREIGVWRMVQMAAIGEKKRRGSHHADGYRSMVSYVAARADVSHQSARSLCWTGSRLEEAPEVAGQLASGEISFDRAEQLARLPEEQREGHESYDISQLKRRVAHYRRMTPKREKRISNSGFLNFQVSADETTTNVWGELPGLDARLVEKAVDQRADEIIGTETQLGVAQRRPWPWLPSVRTRCTTPRPTGRRLRPKSWSLSTPAPRPQPVARAEYQSSPDPVSASSPRRDLL